MSETLETAMSYLYQIVHSRQTTQIVIGLVLDSKQSTLLKLRKETVQSLVGPLLSARAGTVYVHAVPDSTTLPRAAQVPRMRRRPPEDQQCTGMGDGKTDLLRSLKIEVQLQDVSQVTKGSRLETHHVPLFDQYARRHCARQIIGRRSCGY